ncbi:MAG TPA: response regulator transcription factor [Luteolibacter sp.]|nr:response regulator transcription factor [Luteolibacter sp.]
MKILLVEDEAGIAEVMADLLRAEDYEVEICADGNRGLERALADSFDLLILDLMLPGKSGYEICHSVREAGYDGAILILTARGLIEDKVKGLRTGADDYLVKPFDPDELLARTEALLRRSGKASRTPVSKIRFGNVTVDFANNEIAKDGVLVSLTAKEFELLRILVNRRGRTIAREEILAQVWREQPFITPRTVDVHMAWLRQKLEDQPQTPRFLLTVRGEGYRFNAG